MLAFYEGRPKRDIPIVNNSETSVEIGCVCTSCAVALILSVSSKKEAVVPSQQQTSLKNDPTDPELPGTNPPSTEERVLAFTGSRWGIGNEFLLAKLSVD